MGCLMLKRFAIFLIGLCLAAICVQADSSPDFRRGANLGVHYSLSGQFVVHDPPATRDYPPRLNHDTNFVRLEPALLAVSCERIKKSLLGELGMVNDKWQGKIFMDLHHGQNSDEAIVVSPVLYGHRWIYRMELPDLLARSRLVSAVTEVLLLEMANRNADRATEIPAWLALGLSRQMMLASQVEMIVEAPQKSENGIASALLFHSSRRTDPLTLAHADLLATAPLTLEQLSWPKAGQLDGLAGEAYRSSAQLFVHELLQLKDGRACLRAMIEELPQHLNWQIAFRHAFRSDFASQLEVEKWWELHLVQFTGRDLTQTWPSEESWRKLDEIIRPSVEVRTGANDLPLRTQVTLQAIIKDWDLPRQTKLLQEKSQQLLILRMRVSQELIYLVDDYRRILASYVQKKGVAYNPMGRTLYAPRLDGFARDTLRELDLLDARRQQLRPKPESAQPVTASLSGNR